MKIPTNIKLALQSLASNFILLVIFTGAIGLGTYIIGFMVGRFFGLRSGLDGSVPIVASALLASLAVWIPFVLATSGLGVLLLPAFAAYALFVWIGLRSGARARRKGETASRQNLAMEAFGKE